MRWTKRKGNLMNRMKGGKRFGPAIRQAKPSPAPKQIEPDKYRKPAVYTNRADGWEPCGNGNMRVTITP
jgi:hypothetical protein